jgi:iron complex outermembrane receptor protein
LKSGGHDLTLGAEARLHRSTHYGTISYAAGLPPGYDPDYRFYSYEGERDILSAYGHDVVRVSDKVSVMAELQLAYNRYGITDEKYLGNEFSVGWFFANPRAGVSVDFDGGFKGWFSGAYTSREPRMRNLYAAEDSWFGGTPQFEADTAGGAAVYNFDAPLARPEHLLDLEAGTGYASGDLTVRANLFWMEFTDELVKSGQVDIFGQPVTGNAERSRHAGVELEASLRPGALLLSGNLTFSKNTLLHHSVLDDAGNLVALDGNPVAGFPDFLANLRAEYSAGPATFSADAKYVGPFYTDNTKNAVRRNSPFWVANAALVVRPGGPASILSFRAEARNLFNRFYCQTGEGDAFFPAAERNYLFGVTAAL